MLFVAAVLLPLLRQQGVHSWRTIWAEDGGRYAGDALRGDTWVALFRGYAGYAQSVPRLLALGAGTVPLERLSIYLALAGTATGALVALFVHRSLRSWVRDPWLRLVVPALVVLAPVLGFENTANITNTIWVLFAAGAFAFISREERAGDVVARAIAAFLSATSIVLAALLLPLGLTLVALRRRRADFVVLGVFLAGLAVQAGVVLRTDDATPRYPSRAGDLPGLVSVRLLGSLLVGDHWMTRLWSGLGAVTIALFVVVFLAIAVPLAVKGAPRLDADRAERWMPALLAVMALGLFVVPIWVRGTSQLRVVAGHAGQGGSRYVLVPLLLLVTAGCVLADRLGPVVRRLVVAQTALVIACSFLGTNFRSDGPPWPDSVSAASAHCAVAGVASDDAAISPPGWTITVPCSRAR